MPGNIVSFERGNVPWVRCVSRRGYVYEITSRPTGMWNSIFHQNIVKPFTLRYPYPQRYSCLFVWSRFRQAYHLFRHNVLSSQIVWHKSSTTTFWFRQMGHNLIPVFKTKNDNEAENCGTTVHQHFKFIVVRINSAFDLLLPLYL